MDQLVEAPILCFLHLKLAHDLQTTYPNLLFVLSACFLHTNYVRIHLISHLRVIFMFRIPFESTLPIKNYPIIHYTVVEFA